VLENKTRVEATLSSARHWASFLVASTQHSGDWLFVLPIASCGLKLDDEAVRVAVGWRLWLDLCEPHQCHCGAVVDMSEQLDIWRFWRPCWAPYWICI